MCQALLFNRFLNTLFGVVLLKDGRKSGKRKSQQDVVPAGFELIGTIPSGRDCLQI
jgi:hypothetical protein